MSATLRQQQQAGPPVADAAEVRAFVALITTWIEERRARFEAVAGFKDKQRLATDLAAHLLAHREEGGSGVELDADALVRALFAQRGAAPSARAHAVAAARWESTLAGIRTLLT